MDIYQLLPLLEGWNREVYAAYNVTINANEEKEMGKSEQPGWIVAAYINFTGSEYSELALTYYDRAGRKHKLISSPYTLRLHGFVGVGLLNGARLVKADDTNKLYTVMLNPPRPIPFYADAKRPMMFTFKPLLTPATISVFTYEVVQITDKELFIESLRELFSPPQFFRLRELIPEEELKKFV